MTIADQIEFELKLNSKPFLKEFGKVNEQVEEAKSKISGLFKDFPQLNVLGPKGELSGGEGLNQNLINKVGDSKASLTEGEKEALNKIDRIEEILLSQLAEAIESLRKFLENQGLDPEEIEAQVNFVRVSGKERIDNVVENFRDTIEEAVQDLSKKISDAFVEMALKGEFSIKAIGEIFLKTFLDVVARELVQKPLEDILGVILKTGTGVLVGSASGGEIEAGVPTFINEQGQEVFIPHTPGKIVNADQTRNMLTQSPGIVVNQNLSFDTAIKNDMIGTIMQASPLLVEHTKLAVIESLRGRRF